MIHFNSITGIFPDGFFEGFDILFESFFIFKALGKECQKTKIPCNVGLEGLPLE